MKQLIEEKFPLTLENLCIETISYKEFEVIDQSNGKCEVFEGISENAHLRVYNNEEKQINFLAIDQCLFFNQDTNKRCDFALFDDYKICFVEIKTSNTNTTRNSNKKKAYLQLAKTIELFKENNIFFPRTEAYVCLGDKKDYPKINSTNIDKAVEFMDTYNVFLYEGNEESF